MSTAKVKQRPANKAVRAQAVKRGLFSGKASQIADVKVTNGMRRTVQRTVSSAAGTKAPTRR